MTKDASGNRATVECATGEVSVYTRCAFCEHCKGIKVGPRMYPAPQEQVQKGMRRGSASDDALMTAALQFNQLVRDGSAIECADDKNQGFRPRYRL